jgi:Uma2 family endonuclease
MEVEVTRKRFTADEFHRMGEAGILGPEERLELLDGEIIEMSAMGHRHSVCVSRATTFLIRALGDRGVLRPQLPLRLTDWTEPQPDIVVLKPRADFYAKKKPTAQDALLVIEISDSTLTLDRNIKLPKYAAAGIQEVWIGDLVHDVLLVYRNPSGKIYKTAVQFRSGDVVSALSLPDTALQVDELLSTDCEL